VKHEPVRITEHAIVRYLERAMGFNIEAVREHIAGICGGAAAAGAVCVRSEGLRFEITNHHRAGSPEPESYRPGAQSAGDRKEPT